MNIAIISGASSGMGKEFVIQISKKYILDEIWVIARRNERLEELTSLVSTKIVILPLDLTKNESFEIIQNKLNDENPNVKILVNASGFGKFGEFEKSVDLNNQSMCELNFKSLVTMTHIILPYIREKGQIIEVGSLSAFLPVPHLSVYAATKAAVLSFTKALNFELKSRKIHALCLCPYWVKTEFFNRADEHEHIKKLDILYEPSFVVKCALKDVDKKRKEYCVPGKYAKLIVFLSKICSAKFMMKLMDNTFTYEK